MFPSNTKPQKKKRGRQPPHYGPRVCMWCARKLVFSVDTQKHYCKCGWREQ